MAKVFLVVPSLKGGGAERVVLFVARGLRDLGHEATLITLESGGAYENQIPEGVERIDFRDGSNRKAVARLASLIRQRRPEAILAATDAANIVAVLARILSRRKPRVVASIHSTLSRSYSPSAQEYEKKRLRAMRFLLPKADKIVGVSAGVCDDAAPFLGLPRDRFVVIHNPAITPETATLAAMHVDDPWFRPGEPSVVISMGRLHPVKDFPTLIRAFAKLSGQERLMILGEGDQRASLEALVSELGLTDRVRLPGFVDNPYAYLSQARLFVLSSAYEGFGLVIVEALACGTPVVSTNCPYGPEEILEGGRYGSLVPVADSDAMAEAIRSELMRPKSHPPAASWEPYTVDQVARRYEEVLLA
ncbi:glycosyltransferase [soil metagenome]